MSQPPLSDSTFVSAILSGFVAIALYVKTARDKRLQADTDRLFDERLRLREEEFERFKGSVEATLRREIVHSEQIIAAEAKMDEEALALYGINLDERDPTVTPSQIRYLVAIVNAQNAKYDPAESDSAKLRQMFDEDYMRRLFKEEVTRATWRKARRCFRKLLRDNIDQHVRTFYADDPEFENLDDIA